MVAQDARPERIEDDGDDAIERGMTVAAWATDLTIGVIALGLTIAYLWSMHRAGQGRLPW